jgi:hypothetical protein
MNKISKGRYSKVYKVYCGKEKPLVPCRCKCPTCKIEWVEKSNQLDPKIKNYVYCLEHKGNKFKNEGGAVWENDRKNKQDTIVEIEELQETHYNEQRNVSFG